MMKRLFLSGALLFQLAALAQSGGQQTAEKALLAKYPKASEVTWETLNNSTLQADFFEGDIYKVAVFDKSGQWLKTFVEISEEELPEACMMAVSKKYPTYFLYNIEQVETKEGIHYELAAEKDDNTYEISLDSDCRFLKEKQVSLMDLEEEDDGQ